MNKSQRIVKQAGILALAGILVRIIGVLYRSPLTAMIGDEGNGYYSTAYNIYSLVLLISSYSIPTAISKLISEKIVLNLCHCCFWDCRITCLCACTLDCAKRSHLCLTYSLSNNLPIRLSWCSKRLFPGLFNNRLYIHLTDS